MSRNNRKKTILMLSFIFLIFIILAHLLSTWYSFSNSLWIISGTIIAFFLPGFLLNIAIAPGCRTNNANNFKKTHTTPDLLEQIILSTLYSITLVTIALISINSLKIALTPVVVLAAIIAINIAITVGILLNYQHKKNSPHVKNS